MKILVKQLAVGCSATRILGEDVEGYDYDLIVNETDIPPIDPLMWAIEDGVINISYDTAKVLKANKDKLEASAKKFQSEQIDDNTKAEMDKSESLVEAGRALATDLPKSAENGIWLEQTLFGYPNATANPTGCYYARKKALYDGDVVSYDFSNLPACPWDFQDIRVERKTFLASL